MTHHPPGEDLSPTARAALRTMRQTVARTTTSPEAVRARAHHRAIEDARTRQDAAIPKESTG